jgi:undecaprenyl-diphosphatase
MGRLRNAAGRAWGWARALVGRADLDVLLAALAAAAAGWAFLKIAGEVSGGGIDHADARVLRALRDPADPARPAGPRWLAEAARDVTALGGYTVLTLVVGFVAGYLLIARHYPAAILVVASALGGLALSLVLKDLYERPRPDAVPHLVPVSTSSFPSGHAMLAAVVYPTLGALLARLADRWWERVYFLTAAGVLAVLVGASRVYLGVHYPSDVLAGWAAGAAWAIACWLAARYLQRRGVVEGAPD